MAFTNSKLATYVSISPNRTINRNQPITKITIHHMAGVCSLEEFDSIVKNPNRQMSSNYAIDKNARVGLFCEEKDRSWCSSSPYNDHRSITIEVSNSSYGDASGWPISEKVYAKLIDLCVDICQRNNIKQLTFTGDQNGSLTYHYMFSSTACLPINRTELLTPSGWKLLKDIKIGDTIATVQLNDLGIKFDTVENMVPFKIQDTYTKCDFEATSDHRVVYCDNKGNVCVDTYMNIYNNKQQASFINAGYINNPCGLKDIGSSEIDFLVAVQKFGRYIKNGDCLQGIEFTLSEHQKIVYVEDLLNELEIDYDKKYADSHQRVANIKVFDKECVDICKKFLDEDRCFTWDWLNMNRFQFNIFMDSLNKYYERYFYSLNDQNIDVVQAIASLNGIGTKVSKDNGIMYFRRITRLNDPIEKKRHARQKVSCVTVKSGFILIRQNGVTTITGNCPGPWIKAHTQDICNKVNTRLNNSSSTNTNNGTITNNTSFKQGDLISINKGACWYTGSNIPGWVYNEKWYINSIVGDRAVLGQNESKNRNIQSPINTNNISLILSNNDSNKFPYKATLDVCDVYNDNGDVVSSINSSGRFTIVDEKTVDNVVYGKLKSGAGWVIIHKSDNASNVNNKIKTGSLVSLSNDALYYNGTAIPTWVKSQKWYINSIVGDRAVLGQNESKNRNIQSPINIKYLVV